MFIWTTLDKSTLCVLLAPCGPYPNPHFVNQTWKCVSSIMRKGDDMSLRQRPAESVYGFSPGRDTQRAEESVSQHNIQITISPDSLGQTFRECVVALAPCSAKSRNRIPNDKTSHIPSPGAGRVQSFTLIHKSSANSKNSAGARPLWGIPNNVRVVGRFYSDRKMQSLVLAKALSARLICRDGNTSSRKR